MMIDAGALEAQLLPCLRATGPFPDDWPERMARYLNLLIDWNERVNLVSRRSIGRVVEEQLLPSLAALLVVPATTDVRVLDVGSGGGFPGIPLAILRPRARVDLVEATRKKCNFLEAAIREANLESAAAHWCRIEAPAETLRARAPFDVALARAVGNPDAIGPAARRLLGRGALWVYVSPQEAKPEHVWPRPPSEPTTALAAWRPAQR